MSSFASLIGVFLVISAGAGCRRWGWLSEQADSSLAKLLANVLLPAYLASKILQAPPAESLVAAWLPMGFGFAHTALAMLFGWAVAGTLAKSLGLGCSASQRAFAVSVGICNYGYVPFPLALVSYPDAVVDLIRHNAGVELAMWSVGLTILVGASRGGWVRALWSPPFVTVMLASGAAQASLGRYLPEPVLLAVGWIGDCAIPMGLLLSGALIYEFHRSSSWAGSVPVITAGISIRQLLWPVLILAATGVLADFSARGLQLRQVMMLEAAMPSALFPIVLTRIYGGDTSTALKVVLTTTLAGLVTIPCWLAAGKWWLGL